MRVLFVIDSLEGLVVAEMEGRGKLGMSSFLNHLRDIHLSEQHE